MEGAAKSHLTGNGCIILIQEGMKNQAQEPSVPQSQCDPKVGYRNVCFENKLFAKSLYNKIMLHLRNCTLRCGFNYIHFFF